MTRFSEGQKVQAQATTQRLVEGEIYEIVSVRERSYAFGTFVEYELGREGQVTILVRNGHLLLTEVQ